MSNDKFKLDRPVMLSDLYFYIKKNKLDVEKASVLKNCVFEIYRTGKFYRSANGVLKRIKTSRTDEEFLKQLKSTKFEALNEKQLNLMKKIAEQKISREDAINHKIA